MRGIFSTRAIGEPIDLMAGRFDGFKVSNTLVGAITTLNSQGTSRTILQLACHLWVKQDNRLVCIVDDKAVRANGRVSERTSQKNETAGAAHVKFGSRCWIGCSTARCAFVRLFILVSRGT